MQKKGKIPYHLKRRCEDVSSSRVSCTYMYITTLAGHFVISGNLPIDHKCSIGSANAARGFGCRWRYTAKPTKTTLCLDLVTMTPSSIRRMDAQQSVSLR